VPRESQLHPRIPVRWRLYGTTKPRRICGDPLIAEFVEAHPVIIKSKLCPATWADAPHFNRVLHLAIKTDGASVLSGHRRSSSFGGFRAFTGEPCGIASSLTNVIGADNRSSCQNAKLLRKRIESQQVSVGVSSAFQSVEMERAPHEVIRSRQVLFLCDNSQPTFVLIKVIGQFLGARKTRSECHSRTDVSTDPLSLIRPFLASVPIFPCFLRVRLPFEEPRALWVATSLVAGDGGIIAPVPARGWCQCTRVPHGGEPCGSPVMASIDSFTASTRPAT